MQEIRERDIVDALSAQLHVSERIARLTLQSLQSREARSAEQWCEVLRERDGR